MKKIFYITIVFALSSCMKLNDLAFINEALTEFQLDEYTEEVDFILMY